MSAELPPWPTTEPDAPTLIRCLVVDGQYALGLCMGFAGCGGATDPLSVSRHLGSIARVHHAHDVIVVLTRLTALNPAVADELAATLWGMADAGDCYGVALWEWATAAGLDPDAIYDAGKAAAEQMMEANR